MNHVILSLTVLFIIAVPAFGYGYPDAMNQGSTMPGTDAVTQGFAGASAVGVGGMNLFGNPACIDGSRIQFSAGALIIKQTVEDDIGRHTLTYAGLGPTSFQAAFSTGAMNFAAGIARVRDYTYKGEYFFIEEDPDTIIAGYENLQVEGGIWEAAAGLSREIMPGFNFGASAAYRTGTIDYEYYWHHFNEEIEDSTSTWSREEGEFAWRAGASVETSPGTTIGASYASETENCPSSIALGVVFGDLAGGYPGVGVEAALFDTGENTAWKGTVFGGIHPESDLYFRGGVNLVSSGEEEADVSLGLSLGVMVDLKGMLLDAGFTFNSMSRTGNVFGFPEVNSVTDAVSAFSAGLRIPL